MGYPRWQRCGGRPSKQEMVLGRGEVTYDKPGEVGASDQTPINLPTFLHLLIEDSIPFGRLINQKLRSPDVRQEN